VTASFAHSQLDSFVLLIRKTLDFAKSSVIPVTTMRHNSVPWLLSSDFDETPTMISNEVWLESKSQGGGVEMHETLPTLIFAIGGALLLLILAAILVIYLTRRKTSELKNNEIMYEHETEFAEEMEGQGFDEDVPGAFLDAVGQNDQSGGFFMSDDSNFLPNEGETVI
jgi:hypothetical protein